MAALPVTDHKLKEVCGAGVALLAAINAQLFMLNRGLDGLLAKRKPTWDYAGISGKLCFTCDSDSVYHFKIFSSKYVEVFDVQLAHDFEYLKKSNQFHYFKAEDSMVGFNMASISEAEMFYDIVRSRLPRKDLEMTRMSVSKREKKTRFGGLFGTSTSKRNTNVGENNGPKRRGSKARSKPRRKESKESRFTKSTRGSKSKLFSIDDLSPEWKHFFQSAGLSKKDFTDRKIQSLLRQILTDENIAVTKPPKMTLEQAKQYYSDAQLKLYEDYRKKESEYQATSNAIQNRGSKIGYSPHPSGPRSAHASRTAQEYRSGRQSMSPPKRPPRPDLFPTPPRPVPPAPNAKLRAGSYTEGMKKQSKPRGLDIFDFDDPIINAGIRQHEAAKNSRQSYENPRQSYESFIPPPPPVADKKVNSGPPKMVPEFSFKPPQMPALPIVPQQEGQVVPKTSFSSFLSYEDDFEAERERIEKIPPPVPPRKNTKFEDPLPVPFSAPENKFTQMIVAQRKELKSPPKVLPDFRSINKASQDNILAKLQRKIAERRLQIQDDEDEDASDWSE